MKEKKTEVITMRTTPTVKQRLAEEAEKRGWSISQLAERIVATYTEKENATAINFISNTITEVNISK